MTHTKIYCLILLLLCSFDMIAQKGFEPGYIVLTEGGKKRGFIKREKSSNLSEIIKFKVTIEERTEELTPSKVDTFAFDEDKSVFVSIDHVFHRDKIKLTRKRFAKLIVDGHVDLFKMYRTKSEIQEEENDIGIIYYLDKGDELYKLERFAREIRGSYSYADRYVEVLSVALSDCARLRRIIKSDSDKGSIESNSPSSITRTKHYAKSVAYEDEALIDLISRYNRCVAPESPEVVYQSNSKVKAKWGVSASYFNWPEERGNLYGAGIERVSSIADQGTALNWKYGASLLYSPGLVVESRSDPANFGLLLHAAPSFQFFRGQNSHLFFEYGMNLFILEGPSSFFIAKNLGYFYKNISIKYSNTSLSLLPEGEAIHSGTITYYFGQLK